MEICKMITLSTAHITEETARSLEKRYENDPFSFLWQNNFSIYDKDEFGWWINLTDVDYEYLNNCPQDFADCCRLAMRNNCDWLCLDCDGEIVDSLPTYEW